MATPKLFLSKLLRRRLPTLTSITCSSHLSSYHSLSSSDSIFPPQSINISNPSVVLGLPSSSVRFPFPQLNIFFFRSFSTIDSEYRGGPSQDSATQSEELYDPGFSSGFDDADVSEVAGALVGDAAGAGGGVGGEESILPVRALISLLDSYHDFTGFPWWVIIASSTLALRMVMLPMLLLQLKKLKQIAESFPKLPPPLPPPLSGRSYADQLVLFRNEKQAVGCPSYLWFLAYASVQIPCFLLWMTAIRRMSLDHHTGFEHGGTLWFEDLTELPHGLLGPIFPLLIASLHFVNIQVSFQTSSITESPGLFGLLARYYKIYLEVLTLPILYACFCIPQGSLVYWLTNASLTLIQQLTLRHPSIRKKLGLPDKVAPAPTANREEIETSREPQAGLLNKGDKIPVQHLSPRELVNLSVKLLADGHKDRAIPLLRLGLEKDPDCVRALVVMGQTLLQKEQPAEASDYLERAISKLFLIGHPTKAEEVDLLILASQWAGVAKIRQGKNEEGIRHLERVSNLKEPEDSKSKAHYYDSFLLLASALFQVGRKDEAAMYLRKLAAYDSAYTEYLEQCEKDEEDIVNDLVSSRRRDY